MKAALEEPSEAFGALCLLDYLLDLFTTAGKQYFSREAILVILNNVKNDDEITSPEVREAYEQAVLHQDDSETQV